MARATQHVDTTPYWSDRVPEPQFPALKADGRADVVVIGGGITGLTAAYLLAAEGRTVVLLERDRCVQAETGHTSAHLTMVMDAPLTSLVDRFGRDHARAAWAAGLAAITRIETIIGSERIECGFERIPGFFHASNHGAWNRQRFEHEAETAVALGFAAEFVEHAPFFDGPAVSFARQARVHPRKYVTGLARALGALGGQIYEKTAAQEFSDKPLSVKANGHTITCHDIVLATHNPLVGVSSATSAALFQTKLALYTTYVVAGRTAVGRVPDALFWDTDEPYHYLRIDRQSDHDIVILGGADHKTGQVLDTEQCYARLEQRLRSLVPEVELSYRWSGQVIETPDGLPYIGETAPHQFAATGFSGNGLTFGTVGAIMACDRIAGRPNPWTELFDAERTAIRNGLWNYVRENTDYPYHMVRDRLSADDVRSLKEVPPGEGRILTLDGQRVAAHRQDDGRVVVRSAVCTHMGCIVDWNNAERTWDCPCHGSRFTPSGDVISGPAESPLAAIDQKRTQPNER
jgi:glycine/D-amino acid oxidase-like deaminating enzyme/nitrite reductase/ring-hydroxylating ferredoxin subunit